MLNLQANFIDAAIVNDDEEGGTAAPKRKERPDAVDIRLKREDDRDYLHELHYKIKYEGLPEFIIETERLMRQGDSAEGDAIIAYARSIMDRLSVANTGQPSPDLEIFLSDTPGFKVGVITQTPTPVLIIGLGFFDFLIEHGFGEDQVAAAFAHERFHLKRHEKWQHLSNGRPEETVADIAGILEAEKAGYNPEAMGTLFRKLKLGHQVHNGASRPDLLRSVNEVIDEHAPIDDRIRNCDVAIAALQLKRRMTDKQTPIPAQVLDAVDTAHFVNHYEKHLNRNNYAGVSAEGKLDIIAGYFKDALAHEDRYMCRIYLDLAYKDFKDLAYLPGIQKAARRWLLEFAHLKVNWGQSETVKWIIKGLVRLMGPTRPLALKDPEAWEAERAFDNENPVRNFTPLALLRPLKIADRFWSAQSRSEAAIAARLYERTEKRLEKFYTILSALDLTVPHKYWPRSWDVKHSLEDGNESIRIDWHRHAGWILDQDATNDQAKADNAAIAAFLRHSGVNDPRLPGYNKDYGSSPDFDLNDITFSEDGTITALKLKDEAPKKTDIFEADTLADLYIRELDRQTMRDAEESVLVQTVNWRELEKDFWGFIKKHQTYLTPPTSIVKGKHPFAAAFTQRLLALKAGNPKKYNPLCTELLTGYSPKNLKKIAKESRYDDDYDKDPIPVNKLSLPEFAYAYKRDHTGYFHRYPEYKRGRLPKDHPYAAALGQHRDTRRPYQDSDRVNGEYVSRTVYPKKIHPSHHPVRLRLGIDAEHPYVQLALAHDYDAMQRERFLREFDFSDTHARDAESYFNINPADIYGYDAPQTVEAFNELRKFGYTNELNSDPIWRYVNELEALALFRRFSQNPPARMLVSAMDFFTITSTFGHFSDPGVRDRYTREMRRLVNKQLERNRIIDFSDDVPLEDVIDRFLTDHGIASKHYELFDTQEERRQRPWRHHQSTHNIFATRPKLEARYFTYIKGRVMALSLAQRAEPLTQLMALQLQDPQYRTWAVDAWIDSTTMMLGRDDGTQDYAEKALSFIQKSLRVIDSTQGLNAAIHLLDNIEGQRGVTLGTKEILVDVFGQRFFEKDGAMRVIDSAIKTCAHKPELRTGFLKYISSPLSYEGTQEFAVLMKEHGGSGYDASDFLKRFFEPEKRIVMTPDQENMVVDSLHNNFWSMPFELRTLYLDRILFPTQEDVDAIFAPVVTYVLDKVLPLEQKFSAEAREALLIYLDCCPPELRRVTFSAILATSHHSRETEQMRPGQVLSNVLTRTGAAGGQILQAAHSYLNGLNITNPDLARFRDDLVSSKDDFDKPFRWDIFERIDTVFGTDNQERVGKLLGSGSTAYVVEYGADTDALKLMRPDVLSIADLQFERFQACFEKLAALHAIYKPLPDMVTHANALMKVSTDGCIGAEQLLYAQGSYDNLTIGVEDEAWRFHVADVVSSGPEHLRMERIAGRNINKIHKEKGSDHASLRGSSIAIETAFIYRLLQGHAMDQDMHGGQQGINGHTTIGMFDTGAIPYDIKTGKIAVPLSHEKRALGRLLGIALNAGMAGKAPVEALVNAVTSEEWGTAKPYIVGIKRGFLARMDIHAGFGTTHAERIAVQSAIFKSVWQAGQIDHDIFRGLIDTLSLETAARLVLGHDKKESAIALKIIDEGAASTQPSLRPVDIVTIIATSPLRRVFNAPKKALKGADKATAVMPTPAPKAAL